MYVCAITCCICCICSGHLVSVTSVNLLSRGWITRCWSAVAFGSPGLPVFPALPETCAASPFMVESMCFRTIERASRSVTPVLIIVSNSSFSFEVLAKNITFLMLQDDSLLQKKYKKTTISLVLEVNIWESDKWVKSGPYTWCAMSPPPAPVFLSRGLFCLFEECGVPRRSPWPFRWTPVVTWPGCPARWAGTSAAEASRWSDFRFGTSTASPALQGHGSSCVP